MALVGVSRFFLILSRLFFTACDLINLSPHLLILIIYSSCRRWGYCSFSAFILMGTVVHLKFTIFNKIHNWYLAYLTMDLIKSTTLESDLNYIKLLKSSNKSFGSRKKYVWEPHKSLYSVFHCFPKRWTNVSIISKVPLHVR